MQAITGRRGWLAGSSLGALGWALPGPAASTALAAPLPLTAQTTEGPYFLAGMPERADITEGRPGVPLAVRIRVLTAQGQPLPGAWVDLWQCDAAGLYSGYGGQGDDRRVSLVGQTFLRGSLRTGADGAAAFGSIYPGWYAGRTTHIHFKVRVADHTVLTSQFFLPDALSEFIYTQLPGYQRQQLRGVLNRTDGIALMAGPTVIGSVREDRDRDRDRYLASLDTVVDPLARPPVHRPGPGSGPPPGAQRGGGGGPPPGFGGTPALPVPEGEARVRALVPGSKS